jgi:hypothetical protein
METIIYISKSKDDFMRSFSEDYAMAGQTLDQLRLAVGNMVGVRLLNPNIQPYPDFDSDDLDDIAKYAYESVNDYE